MVYRRGPDVTSRSFQGDPQAGVHVGDGFMSRGVKESPPENVRKIITNSNKYTKIATNPITNTNKEHQ